MSSAYLAKHTRNLARFMASTGAGTLEQVTPWPDSEETMTKSISVAIDQGVDLKKLRPLQQRGVIVLHQVHDLEQSFTHVTKQGRAFTLDHSRLGGPDLLADEKYSEVLHIVGPSNINDARHVYAAYLNRDDYFITENPDQFIYQDKRTKLEALLGVKIRRTEEFVLEIVESKEE